MACGAARFLIERDRRVKARKISVSGIGKHFGATVALADVTIDFQPGTVHALMGANGSGKSTLSKILAGVLKPDTGTITLDGRVFEGSPRDCARKAGTVAVFQETSLIPDLSVQDNIWLGHEPCGPLGVDTAAMRDATLRLIALLDGIADEIRPELPVRKLGPASRQLVELLKALSRDPAVVILDEVTASLDVRQAERVADLARGWRADGRIVIMVTHRMHEVFALADTLSVLRNGKLVDTLPADETDEARLVDMMVGAAARRMESRHHAAETAPDTPALRFTAALAPVTPFEVTVHQGEVVGLAGLQGQGQSTLLRGVFEGARAIQSISVAGKPVHIGQPADAVDAGLALVPSDRNSDGLFRNLSVLENIMSASWRRQGSRGLLNLRRIRARVEEIMQALRIKAASPDITVGTLSGGNAQKVVLGRWLAVGPDYLLLDDPTKGIDVNARVDFYEALARARANGLGILVYSSDEHELATLCDRVIVMREGRKTAELSGAHVRAEDIARAGLMEKA